MTPAATAQLVLFLAVVLALTKPVGGYLIRVFSGQPTVLDPVLRPVERAIHRLLGVDPKEEMTWGRYAISFALFSTVGAALLFALLVTQRFVQGPPAEAFLTTPMTTDLAVNTAVSFATTTTWQAYGGETTMRYATQIIGLAAQNFLAGAAGLAVGIAFIRGVSRSKQATLGNFWFDVVRAALWVLLPMSVLGTLYLVIDGVPLNLAPYTEATTLEGGRQIIAQGPVAALEWIKNLGTNGGGFFNVNAAHPYENPTPLTNFMSALAIVTLPAGLTYTLGRMTGRPRLGWMLFGTMMFLTVVGLVIGHIAESAAPPSFAQLGIVGGNLEGKEVRFGVGGSVLAAVVTSNGATGSYASMHGSYSPIAILVMLVNMLLGEIAFGGLGSGLYSMMITALVALFIAGLMVGRTPVFHGKSLGPREVKLIVAFTLVTAVTVLVLTALAVVTPGGVAGLTTNSGAHGLSEILFAFASNAGNNGMTMAGLSANSPFWNATTTLAMLAGRFGLAIPALALASSLAAQSRRVEGPGSVPMDTVGFGALVVATALVVTGLGFLPALVLGPILEHLQNLH